MKRSDFISAALTSLVISSLLLFLSCASEERVEDDAFAELGSDSSETTGFADGELDGSGMDAMGGDEMGLPADSDLAPVGEETTEDPFAFGDDTQTVDDFNAAPDMDSGLGLPSEDELAAATDGDMATTTLPPDENLDNTFGADESLVGMEPDDGSLSASLESDPNFDPVLGLPSETAIAKAEEQENTAKEMAAFAGEDFADGQGFASEPIRTQWSGASKLPSIPSQAFDKNGTTLNRFYFVRQGDTAESISSLIYGNSSRSADLKSWNRGSFKPGKLIFYQSAQQPQDFQMRSLYQEKGLRAGEVVVNRGETLSQIAKNELGSFMSYKELAVVNGLMSADGLEPGQRLAIYRDLRAGGNGNAVAANQNSFQNDGYEEAVEPNSGYEAPSQESPNSPPAFQAENQVQFSPPPPVQQRPNFQSREPRRPTKKGFDIWKAIQQNMFFIVVGVGILSLLAALIAVNKRKKARQSADDFNDDIFGDQMNK